MKNQNLPPKTTELDRGESELHDDAPKNVEMHHAPILETTTVKGFHLEPQHGEGTKIAPPRGLRHLQVLRPLELTRC
jgi:hypothetical protein